MPSSTPDEGLEGLTHFRGRGFNPYPLLLLFRRAKGRDKNGIKTYMYKCRLCLLLSAVITYLKRLHSRSRSAAVIINLCSFLFCRRTSVWTRPWKCIWLPAFFTHEQHFSFFLFPIWPSKCECGLTRDAGTKKCREGKKKKREERLCEWGEEIGSSRVERWGREAWMLQHHCHHKQCWPGKPLYGGNQL